MNYKMIKSGMGVLTGRGKADMAKVDVAVG
jgi:hypothetical protein